MVLKKESSASKFIVLGGCLLSMIMCLGFNTTSLAILLPSWSEEMGWGNTEYALAAGAVAMGTVWTAWLAGILLDKFNPKTLMVIAIILNGCAMAARGFITSIDTAYIILSCSGITAALINPGCLKTAQAWFDRKWTYRVNGILISGGAIGYFIGFNGTIPWSATLGGWDNLFLWVGIIIVVFGVLWIFIVPARSEEQGAMNQDLKVKVEGYTVWRKLKECFQSRQVRFVLLSEFFIAGAILTFSSVGPMAFLGIWEGIDAQKAGFIISMSNIGSTIGYWVLPPIAVKVGYRKAFIIPAVIWSCTLYTLAPFSGNVLLACIMINLAGFANGWGLTGGRTLMMEHPDVAGVKAGTAGGLLIELNKIGCVVFPLIFTTLLDSAGIVVGWVGMFAIGAIGGVTFISLAQDTGRKALAKRAAEESEELKAGA